ncbi:MAG: low-specificity L-threonine aldolase [Anaerolineae bacterium]|nr:low-specificity L-threonine aldolase [Anaerolineae bacterium]NUQ03479.1 low-specificity L-threonine aldolase [Anaerolineae bacterium]
MQFIDLRSDTVTQPTPEMREAMANAPVGDDVYGEDPTINQLQAKAAALFGKEAGLFVASGTMGNLCSVLTHCGRGDEMIIGKQSHIFRYEVGSAAAYGGVHPNTLEVRRDGTMDLNAIRDAIRSNDEHEPSTRLICLENTHGGASGAPLSAEYVAQVAEIARQHHLKLHIDGARIFNAAAALNTSVSELCRHADSVTFCLSKGLSAPVGSVIVGTRDFIRRAHKVRKSLGGGMRQAGILAAAGLVALHTMPQRLHEDHLKARVLAEGLAQMPYLKLDLESVRTNMIFFTLAEDAPVSLAALSRRLKHEFNIMATPYNDAQREFRLVTHTWIKQEDVETILEAFRVVLSSERAASPAASD